ncbi:MAG: biotin transporter BioY [Clostridia bacterium]|nr:biotin transporter BioY [Clostridia bacterium]
MTTRTMTLAAMLTALLCIVGPLTLPIGPVPVSLLTAVLLLTAMLLGGRLAVLACGVYLLLGLLGLPVLSGFTGGAGQFVGPTGGYLVGYLPMTFLAGAVCARTDDCRFQALVFIAATILLYAVGTVWYCMQSGVTAGAACLVCVLPFLPFDAVKIAAVLAIGPRLKRRLRRLRLLS